MRLRVLVLAAFGLLAGCAAEAVWAPDEAVARAAYRHEGPPRLTVFTMINNESGAGMHTSLMINGAQRVIFDPAGSFHHETIPERHDVLFGITSQVADVYTRYHARKTYHVQIQRLDVSPEMAARAMQLVQSNGAVAPSQCALATSRILGELFPGQVRGTWFPRKIAEDFGKIPGVTEEKLYEYDGDDNSNVLAAWDPTRAAAQ